MLERLNSCLYLGSLFRHFDQDSMAEETLGNKLKFQGDVFMGCGYEVMILLIQFL